MQGAYFHRRRRTGRIRAPICTAISRPPLVTPCHTMPDTWRRIWTRIRITPDIRIRLRPGPPASKGRLKTNKRSASLFHFIYSSRNVHGYQNLVSSIHKVRCDWQTFRNREFAASSAPHGAESHRWTRECTEKTDFLVANQNKIIVALNCTSNTMSLYFLSSPLPLFYVKLLRVQPWW